MKFRKQFSMADAIGKEDPETATISSEVATADREAVLQEWTRDEVAIMNREAVPEEQTGDNGKAQHFYSSKASKMKQIKEQQRALDEEAAPPFGLIAPARAPREQATVPASIGSSEAQQTEGHDRSWAGYIVASLGCCTSTGRRQGLR
eukprot:TRINITY_DN1906_c0_g1_i2.p1 TRINITY_DN1906_c0_g1~~TRINITY_DN1906_c0_g1_i2.p1  ORF type:complete len:148 (+),score=32.11 TRINITY_DN1906_c0_g1_i2:35-478(+)